MRKGGVRRRVPVQKVRGNRNFQRPIYLPRLRQKDGVGPTLPRMQGTTAHVRHGGVRARVRGRRQKSRACVQKRQGVPQKLFGAADERKVRAIFRRRGNLLRADDRRRAAQARLQPSATSGKGAGKNTAPAAPEKGGCKDKKDRRAEVADEKGEGAKLKVGVPCRPAGGKRQKSDSGGRRAHHGRDGGRGVRRTQKARRGKNLFCNRRLGRIQSPLRRGVRWNSKLRECELRESREIKIGKNNEE